jgi:hypothetical protein
VDTHSLYAERPEFSGNLKQCKNYFAKNYYPKAKSVEEK